MLQVYFFRFADKVWTLSKFLDYFLIFLAPISHQPCFNLATPEQSNKAIWLVFVKKRQGWHSLFRPEFRTSHNLIFRNVKRDYKLRRVCRRNVKSVVFYQSKWIFKLPALVLSTKMLISALPHKLFSYTINLPALQNILSFLVRLFFFVCERE